MSSAIIKDLVLIGGGHSHVIVLKLFAMKPLPGVRLTLITDVSHTPYSGMLPGYVAGFYDYDECHIDLRSLAQFAQAQIFVDQAIELNLDKNQVICANRPPISFDLLSIDIGSTPHTLSVPGATDYVIPIKPVPQFLTHWQKLIENRQNFPENPLTIAIVGGGVGGVELALNMQSHLLEIDAIFDKKSSLPINNLSVNSVEFHLFHSGDELVPSHNQFVRDRLKKILINRGIQLHLKEIVCTVEKHKTDVSNNYQICCQSGLTVLCDRIFWVTQASAPPWLKQSGLATDETGFIQVNDYLQSVSHPHIFAAGDIATMMNHPRPKAGVFAVRQGKPLFENLQRFLLEKKLKSFVPQKQYLALIGTGNQSAIASRGPFMWESPLLWQWKDWIDRKFMEKFSHLPSMEKKDKDDKNHLQLSEMRCAGCGSKVGSNTLERVLNRLNRDFSLPSRTDVIIGLNSPDDCAVVEVPSGQLMVHTIDYFSALINDPFIFGQITANHCLSDIFAMGATPQTALAIAAIPYGIESKVEETLYQLLAGAIEVLNQSQTALVGGHTTEASELAFGLSCNGFAHQNQLLKKGGIKPGQVLILTKPLGTGTLFAAEMRSHAKGRWIDGAIESMLLSNQAAASCFLEHQASACTDITGFGLMGHLKEMIQASKLVENPEKNSLENPESSKNIIQNHENSCTINKQITVELYLESIPILEGALKTLKQGIYSSLHPQNLQVSSSVDNLSEMMNHPIFPVLFDPQTAGGLLATVPEEKAQACLTSLQASGYLYSNIIGRVKMGAIATKPVTLL